MVSHSLFFFLNTPLSLGHEDILLYYLLKTLQFGLSCGFFNVLEIVSQHNLLKRHYVLIGIQLSLYLYICMGKFLYTLFLSIGLFVYL